MLSNLSTPEGVRFEIYGAVKQPGLYSAPANIRVEDAVSYAGGFYGTADVAASNLTKHVFDGDRILIPTQAPFEPTITPAVKGSIREQIDLNTAEIEALMSLPGIGEKKAKDILDFREANGGFTDVADLLDVPGIGEKTIEQFLDLVTVNEAERNR